MPLRIARRMLRRQTRPIIGEGMAMKKVRRILGLLLLGLLTGFVPGRSAAQSGPPLPPIGWPLEWWRFDDTNWLTTRGFPPISFTNIDLVPDWDTNALQVDSTNPAWLQYNVIESDGHTNLPITYGSVRFWYLPNWSSTNQGGTGPGVWGRLIDVGKYTTNASYGWWSLYLDPAGDNLYFSAQTNTGIGTNYLTFPISWDSATWHQISLAYSSSNTALFLDGAAATNGPGISIWPGPGVVTNGFFVGSDHTGIAQAHGQFDDLWTYSFPLDTYDALDNYLFFDPLANPVAGGGFHMDGMGFTPGTTTNSQYSSNELWLGILPPGTNSWATNANASTVTIFLNNTIADIEYELLVTTNPNVPWTVAQTLIGSETTNYTVTTVPLTNAETVFFNALAYTLDSDNVGIPDWWQLKYFGYVGIDPNGDPAGDGWSNIQKYENGMNPNVFYTPPAPSVFTINLNTNGNFSMSWSAAANLPTNGAGAVTGYTLSTPQGTFTIAANQTNETVNGSDYLSELQLYPGYNIGTCSVQINYANGSSSSATSSILNPAYSVEVYAIRGVQGRVNLVAPTIPANVKAIRVWPSQDDNDNTLPSFDAPVSAFTNGVYIVPDSLLTPYRQYQFVSLGIGYDGTLGSVPPDLLYPSGPPSSFPFLDGRRHIQQSLAFLLQASTESEPYSYYITIDYDGSGATLQACPDEYAYAGFYPFDTSDESSFLDEYRPFEDNYFLHNFVFSTGDLNANGSIATGAFSFGGAPAALQSSEYTFNTGNYFDGGSTNTPAPILTNTQWAYPAIGDIGVAVNTLPSEFVLPVGQSNWFGLPYETAKCAYATNSNLFFDTLNAGGSPLLDYSFLQYHFYSGAAAPDLETIGYYFARPYIDPLPGDPAFAVTNSTPPLMITSVGRPSTLAAYAKQRILNGDPSKFAYPEQYFDAAYAVNAGGAVTSQATGILSPFGDFFPTQPGPTALVTMQDIDTGQRGTNIIQVISLDVDANHDGTMDLTFFGPDFTSAARPFVFWANNNYDRWDDDGVFSTREQDDLLASACPYDPTHDTPDYNYTSFDGYRAIPTTRDLEDFTRLWISGVTTNLLAALPANSTITLNWGDVGSPNVANPTIDLFEAADADGGAGYLTNSASATNQINNIQSPYVGRLGPGQSIQIYYTFFTNYWLGNHFIWCGVSNGGGALNLTIADANGNTLAQATTYIQIVDIKQLYERWTVGDRPNVAPTNVASLTSEGLSPGVKAFQYTLPTETNIPYILYVHGYNMALWEKDRFAETEFKRLYWQGYQGRFGAFNWPTANHALQFGSSELQAWDSAPGLLNLLNKLNSVYPGQVYVTAHSLGNVVAGEALRLAGTNQVVNTYVAMQGAVAAHAYDATTPIYTLLDDSGTPDCYAHYWTNGAPCYFNDSKGAGRYVNFFNTNDWALHNAWLTFQNAKPLLNPDYSFTPPDLYYKNDNITELFFPTNTYELFDSLIQARSYALGMQGNVGGVFKTLTYNQVELDIAPYNFGTAHIYHSGEFRSDNVQRWQFWNQALLKMGLRENP
jgi:hypothetical protein